MGCWPMRSERSLIGQARRQAWAGAGSWPRGRRSRRVLEFGPQEPSQGLDPQDHLRWPCKAAQSLTTPRRHVNFIVTYLGCKTAWGLMDLGCTCVPCFSPLSWGGSKHCFLGGCNGRVRPLGMCGHHLAPTVAIQSRVETHRRFGNLPLTSRK